jgi:hypothetical protein
LKTPVSQATVFEAGDSHNTVDKEVSGEKATKDILPVKIPLELCVA